MLRDDLCPSTASLTCFPGTTQLHWRFRLHHPCGIAVAQGVTGLTILMRHLPNLISLSRLVAAVLLITGAVLNATRLCLALFIYCLVSDVVDGRLARAFGVTSVLGARLDSLADRTLSLTAPLVALRLLPALRAPVNEIRVLAVAFLLIAPGFARAQLSVGGFVGGEFDNQNNWLLFGAEARVSLQKSMNGPYDGNVRLSYHSYGSGASATQLDVNLLYNLVSHPATPLEPFMNMQYSIIRDYPNSYTLVFGAIYRLGGR
jgi:hypothetical protein